MGRGRMVMLGLSKSTGHEQNVLGLDSDLTLHSRPSGEVRVDSTAAWRNGAHLQLRQLVEQSLYASPTLVHRQS